MGNMEEKSVIDMLDEEYRESGNKDEIDYWIPLSKIIVESIELRDSLEMSQTDLASKMKTRQSVISRFENMGRIPNYKFIARLSLALGHAPGMTLHGDYMGVVPIKDQQLVREMADKENMSTQRFVQSIIDQGISTRIDHGTQPIKDTNTFSAMQLDVGFDSSTATIIGNAIQPMSVTETTVKNFNVA